MALRKISVEDLSKILREHELWLLSEEKEGARADLREVDLNKANLNKAIGIAIARIGCFLEGCCYGKVCHLPWAVSFPRTASVYLDHKFHGLLPPDATVSLAVHPLQMYFALAGLALTPLALWAYSRKKYDGQVALVVLLGFSLTAAALEFLRADSFPRLYWGPLPQLEWVALGLVGVSIAALIISSRRARLSSLRTEPRATDLPS